MPSMCFEALAAVWIYSKKQILPEPVEQQVFTAQDNLEQCRKSMELRERELLETIAKLAKEAVAKKKLGDITGARLKAAERSRALKRLEKLRSSMNIIDTQLDTIKSTELDKEIMMSLKASSTALKKAGIGVKATEVENVMQELDDHMKDMQDINSVLSNPVASGSPFDDEEELDAELQSLLEEEEQADSAVKAQTAAPAAVTNKMMTTVEVPPSPLPVAAKTPKAKPTAVVEKPMIDLAGS